jgi:hypothetical protein
MTTFLDGFADELTKVATLTPGGLAAKIRPMMRPAAKVLGGAAAGAGLYSAGKHRGIKAEEGAAIGATQQAYKMGISRGAMAMRDAIMKQLGSGISERE